MMIALLLLLTAELRTAPTRIGLRVTTPQYDGVIIAPERIGKAAWVAGPAHVAEFETALTTFLNGQGHSTRLSSELRRYKRQYWALMRNGHKVLSVCGFHETKKPVATNEWLDNVWSVAGGGDFFFRADYDFATKRIHGGPNAPK